MSRITVDNLAPAIPKVRSMSLTEKEVLAEEIHQRQPHMLASCLVQSRLGVEAATVENNHSSPLWSMKRTNGCAGFPSAAPRRIATSSL
jgi:hypothetical protein